MIRWHAVLLVALSTPAIAATEVVTRTYVCERGVEIPATYVNADDKSLAVVEVEGRQITLEAAPTASGVRYVGPAKESGYVWWTKGDTAILDWFDAEIGEEVTLFRYCAAD